MVFNTFSIGFSVGCQWSMILKQFSIGFQWAFNRFPMYFDHSFLRFYGHSYVATTLTMMGHMFSMFAPSVLTGKLITRFGSLKA